MDDKIVTETVLLTLCDENNNVYYLPPSFVMEHLETIKLIIKMGNYNLLRNLPNATFYLFLDEIATCVNDYKAYDLLESLSGDFFIEHEDLFFKILRDETIPYIDPNVMLYYAPSLPKDVLSYKNFYSCCMCGESAFSIYFEYNEKKVEEYFCNYYPFVDRKVDLSFKYGLTHDMIRKIYSYFKIFVERHCKDDEVNKEYFNFIHWTFHANWLKGVPDVVEDICFNSHLALSYYGKNVSSPEMILKIIKRNPEDIVYLEEIFLSKVEITKEALDSI